VRRRVYGLVLSLALISCCAAWAAAEAADVAGNWQIQRQGRQGLQQGTLTLLQNRSELTGALAEPARVGSAERRSEGQCHYDESLAVTGTVEGDKMSGTFQPQGGHGGAHGENGQSSRRWTAMRQNGSTSQPDQSGNTN
jgi:hypothetical protein